MQLFTSILRAITDLRNTLRSLRSFFFRYAPLRAITGVTHLLRTYYAPITHLLPYYEPVTRLLRAYYALHVLRRCYEGCYAGVTEVTQLLRRLRRCYAGVTEVTQVLRKCYAGVTEVTQVLRSFISCYAGAYGGP